jgi:hypothetical protein
VTDPSIGSTDGPSVPSFHLGEVRGLIGDWSFLFFFAEAARWEEAMEAAMRLNHCLLLRTGIFYRIQTAERAAKRIRVAVCSIDL